MTREDKKIFELLQKRDLTVGTAESCSGGLIGARITRIPGISQYYRGGVIAYANEVKVRELKVDPQIISRYGAVSRQAAEAMAAGIIRKLEVDIGISVTGIAGPSGGTRKKPVGLVFIGLAEKKTGNCSVAEYRFSGSRHEIRRQTVGRAIDLLKKYLV